jgi:hypothetical protein
VRPIPLCDHRARDGRSQDQGQVFQAGQPEDALEDEMRACERKYGVQALAIMSQLSELTFAIGEKSLSIGRVEGAHF